MTPNISESPAVGVLIELEAAGIRVVEHQGDVYVRPANLLTDHQRAILRREREVVVLLLRTCDEGVMARRTFFDGLIALNPQVVLPALCFRPDVPYARHVCYSCGDAMSQTWGRCWRCSLAARLACRQAISPELCVEYDFARVVA